MDVDVTGNSWVGGLVGHGKGPIEGSQVSGSVTGQDRTGGLVGFNERAEIQNSHANVTVTSTGMGGRTGGLVGSNWDPTSFNGSQAPVNTISNCTAQGVVSGDYDFIGGLVGWNNGRIEDSAALNPSVTGRNSVGGLVGQNNDNNADGSNEINRSYATTNVTGTKNYIGGLVGWNNGNIRDAYASGDVTGTTSVGGLVGANQDGGSISDSRADSDVNDPSGDDAKSNHGGLVGHNFGSITQSVATGDILGTGQTNGGLVGRNEGAISHSAATGTVDAYSYAGGLVGFHRVGFSIVASHASGDATAIITTAGDSGTRAGGLAGGADGAIIASSASGNVVGRGVVGGLVGQSANQIKASYASGNVIGTGDQVGGLVGAAVNGNTYVTTPGAAATNSYAVGRVSRGAGQSNVGGFAGEVLSSSTPSLSASVTDGYWNTTTSTLSVGIGSDDEDNSGVIDGMETTTPGLSGQTTSELQAPTDYTGIYANWNETITDVTMGNDGPWDFGGATDYPELRNKTNPPAFASGTISRTVNEDLLSGALVGSPLTASDSDGDTLTYKLVGADAKHFSINSSTGQLQTDTEVDYENPVDADRDNTYEFVVQASDGTLADFRQVMVRVIDRTENLLPPVISGNASVMYLENATGTVGSYSASDPERATTTWEELAGPDAAAFSFSERGALSFNNPPDYEIPNDASPRDGVYNVTLSASDGRMIGSLDVVITIVDVDEPPLISGSDSVSWDENRTGTVATYTARDPEGGTTPIAWTLSGTDAGDFLISDTPGNPGLLTFMMTPDHENPTDSNRDNVYQLVVRASDGSQTGTLDVTVTVMPINEPPVISGDATPSLEEEGSLFVGTYQAEDPERAPIAWLPLLGVDDDKFEFNSSNGRLEFKIAPNYEDFGNVGGDNMYDVTLSASAGGDTATFDIAVSVTNKEEAGSLSFSSPQPQADIDYTATLSDPDGESSTSWTWERSTSSSGPWAVVTGAISSSTTSTYRPDADDVGNYLRVSASYTDGHGPDKSLVLRSPNSVRAARTTNTPPVFDTPTTTREVAENARANATVGAAVIATDPDAGDVLTYTLSGSSHFTIDLLSGQIRVASGAMLDHELDQSHDVTITASDPMNDNGFIDVTIEITDVNEPPVAVDDLAMTDEDIPTRPIDVLSNDTDPEDLTRTTLIVEITRNPTSGKVDVTATEEVIYTPKADFSGDDSFQYRIYDGELRSAAARVVIDVRPVNDAPAFPDSPIKREVVRFSPEGTKVGKPINATDIDHDAADLNYFLFGPAEFEIEQDSGQILVTAGASLDPTVTDTYMVTVRVEDADGASDSVEVTIKVVEQITRVVTTGGGGGGGGGGPPPVPVPSDADFDWNVTRDIDELDRDNDLPTDIWSDGKTLWVVENSASGADRVFAYDLQTGERQPDAEFEFESRNRFSHGIWSDGETIWIADSGQDKLFAYNLASGERLEERDIELTERNRDPRGIWSDGETLYVLDSVKDALFVYDFETGELVAEHPLDKLNKSPRGIWSDGVTIWVSDDGAKRLFAYRIEDGALVRYEDEEFTFRSLLKAGNGDARGIWSDGDVIFVADEQDDKVYSYNIPDAIDARLASLSLSDIDIGEFSSNGLEYAAIVGSDTSVTTVDAEATQEGANVVIEPSDADGDPENGHQVSLDAETTITITVTSEEGTRTTNYGVQVSKPPCLEGLSEERLSEVSFVGGSVSELEACARSANVNVLYHHRNGVWTALFLFPELPEFLSRPFRARFQEDLPPGELLIANRQSVPITAPGTPSSK